MRVLIAASVLILSTLPASTAAVAGNAEAGRQLVTRSCTTCHATNTATSATDGVPPLSVLAKNNKERPAWIRGWLMEPHPPMPNISL